MPLQREEVLRRNNVVVRGTGTRPMLFAHGFGCDQNMWRWVAPAFEASHRTVLFDYVGCGRSDVQAFDATRYATLDGYAQDVLDICEVLGLEEVTLVGHSVSAMVGLMAANRAPSRFSSLIMLAPSPRFLNDPPDYVGGFEAADLEGLLTMMEHNHLGWAGYLAPLIMGNAEQPQLAAELEESFCSIDRHAARVFARATFFADNRADLARLQVPCLVVQVAQDALVPISMGPYLDAHMPGAQRVVLDAAGHCPHMSHPELTIAAMREFLNRPNAGR